MALPDTPDGSRRKRRKSAPRSEPTPSEVPTSEGAAADAPSTPASQSPEPVAARILPISTASEPGGGTAEALAIRSRHTRLQRQLSFAFGTLFVVGAVATVLDIWYIPPISVFAYFILGFQLTSRQRSPEKFADGLYYMGFLFTLWSLFVAFAPWKANQRITTTEEIITLFGIALITTVIGITCRIFLLQFRQTVSDQEEDAQEHISALADQLASELEQTVSLLRTAKARMAEQAELAVGEIVGRVNGAIDGQLSVGLGHLTTSIGQLSERISAIHAPADLLSSKVADALRPAGDQLARLSQEIADAGQKLQTAVSHATSASTSISEANTSLAGTLSSMTGSAIAMQGTLSSVTAAAESFAAQQRSAAAALAEVAANLSALRAALQGRDGALASQTDALINAVSASAKSVAGNVAKFEGVMAETIDFLKREIARR
jgi:hypothetical protein